MNHIPNSILVCINCYSIPLRLYCIIIITIKDSGKGITPKNLERVFESFYTTKSTGSGLGLTIVRNIIENYNGRIDLASAVGDGTLVEIRFPLVISFTV